MKDITKRLHMIMNALVLLMLMAAALEASSLTFTQLDVPGATSTLALGINDAGQIVGLLAMLPAIVIAAAVPAIRAARVDLIGALRTD